MNKVMKNIQGLILAIVLIAGAGLSVSSCGKDKKPSEDRKVMIMMSLGYNSISAYLKEDLNDLKQGYLPTKSASSDVLLIYSKQTKKSSDYSTPSESALIRLYKDKNGVAIMDTLQTYPSSVISSTPQTIRNVLTYVQQEFKAKSYGIVFSSHGTGWLPPGYYAAPNNFTSSSISPSSVKDRTSVGTGPHPVPYVEVPQDPNLPAVKTLGQEVVMEGTKKVSYELEIEDLAGAIPMHLDYFLIDACLMGGIETAYALRNVADVIGFSPAEVLAEGFNYKTITQHLLQKKVADPVSVCKDYYDYYDAQSGTVRSATITVVDTKKLDAIATVCKDLFSKYREQIAAVSHSKVQVYYRQDHHWFYDLEDILIQAGASDEDIKRLSDAVSTSILYKGATPSFMGEFDIKHYSGYSMYLPNHGSTYLDNYYRNLSWNNATLLVPQK